MSATGPVTPLFANAATHSRRLLQLAAALAAGVPLYFMLGPQPVPWLAWCAPVPVLWLVLHSSRRDAAWSGALAAAVGLSSNLAYMSLLMPLAAVLAVLAFKALLWVLVLLLTRRVVLRYRSNWCVLAYPLLWVAIDTLMASLLPDGNWGSLAYSQADQLPLLQVVALAGVPGLLFLVCLAPSAMALLLAGGRRHASAAIATAALLALAWAGGAYRLQATPAAASGALVGLAVIDDFLAPQMPPALAQAVWDRYAQQVAQLAGQGATVVLLPEKIATLSPDAAAALQQRFDALARRLGVWIALGVAVHDSQDGLNGTDVINNNGSGKRNLAWLFSPDGKLSSYQKHHLAPPERDFLAGSAYQLQPVAGQSMGLAICKDMHFAAFGHAYGAAGAQAMLVPAWDFGLDAWMGARMTLVRGVENGYGVVRAAREGLLTVSDAYGRIVAERASCSLPGSMLLAPIPGRTAAAPWARWLGPLFGWLCVAASASLLALLLHARLRRQP